MIVAIPDTLIGDDSPKESVLFPDIQSSSTYTILFV
jgi:hypothetical protein